MMYQMFLRMRSLLTLLTASFVVGTFISTNLPTIVTVVFAVTATIFGCLRIFWMTLVVHEGRNFCRDTLYPCGVCKAGKDQPCTGFITI